MNYTSIKVKVRELADGYFNSAVNGVFALKGRLNIRPAYQREFVYGEKLRDRVMESIRKNRPLGLLYWSKNPDGSFEVIDGQQRIISIMEYVAGRYSINFRFFHNLTQEEKDQILDYELEVKVCTGTESERLEWFQVINLPGMVLTDQELRNAAYTGPWLADAKLYFSRAGHGAAVMGKDYVSGAVNRQDYLETALDWITNGQIESYMGEHQHDKSAEPLWLYFQQVINWTQKNFKQYRKEMKGVDWGYLYNQFKEANLNPEAIEEETKALMMDPDVTKKSGIYPYILTGNEKHLSIRAFEEQDKRAVYEKQNGICPKCGKVHDFEKMEADHITPWSEGGRTIVENCQMLCKECNRRKSNK